MSSALTGAIVCATRGGEGSRAVQIAAIEQAKATNNPLIFLYVTDPESLGIRDAVLAEAVAAELDWMGETLLRTAQRRADFSEIHSEVRIRQGKMSEQIPKFLLEYGASLLLLGAPRGTTANVFGDDAVERFAEMVQRETGTPVLIVRPD